MIDVKDAERIVKEKEMRLEDLARPEVWNRYTKHMECGEIKEFRQSCIDDEIIIEALNKQIPKTVVVDGDGWSDLVYCPRCSRILGVYINDNCIQYCPECGQALKWRC